MSINEVIANYKIIGYSKEEIIEKLIQQGYTEDEIASHTSILENIPSKIEQKPKRNIWKILGYIGLGLLLILKYGIKCRALYTN